MFIVFVVIAAVAFFALLAAVVRFATLQDRQDEPPASTPPTVVRRTPDGRYEFRGSEDPPVESTTRDADPSAQRRS
jgi:hypothetical protein